MTERAEDIRIRQAGAEDLDRVLALVPQLVAFGPPPWRNVPQMIETDRLVIAGTLQGTSTRAIVLVAEDVGGELAGFIHLCVEVDYYTRKECTHIADIVVAPEARGRGIGEMLLARAEQWARARGHSLLSLNVFIENARARTLYERTGFSAETMRYVKNLR